MSEEKEDLEKNKQLNVIQPKFIWLLTPVLPLLCLLGKSPDNTVLLLYYEITYIVLDIFPTTGFWS